ncbi:MAG: DUF6402 family protein [Kiritimatiellia bacterium]
MSFYGYRFYAPEIGRWPSRDPIEESGGSNINLFSRNSPVDYFDYLGLATTVEQLPDILNGPKSKYNYQIAGRFMRRFLDNPAAQWETTTPDTNSITIDMLLKHSGAQRDYDRIFDEKLYTDERAKGVILAIINNGVGVNMRFGPVTPLLAGNYPEKFMVHNSGSIALTKTYGAYGGDGGPIAAALGQFDWRVAVSGVRKSDESNKVCVAIDQVHIWMRDAYEFDGVDSDPNQYLGHWDAAKNSFWSIGSYSGDATIIRNKSFLDYTARTGKGEEFAIFSEVRTVVLPTPVIIYIPFDYKAPPSKK